MPLVAQSPLVLIHVSFVRRSRVLTVKYSGDTRYSEEAMATHDQREMSALPVSRLADVPQSSLDNADVIGIDEGSFFPDLLEFCDAQANAGKEVIVASLDGDFQRKPFGDICELVPRAEEVTKLTAVCTGCGKPACFSRRLSAETAVEVIGGADKYIATCRACHQAPDLLDVLARRESATGTDSAPSSPVSGPGSESESERPETKAAVGSGANVDSAAALVVD
jgi:thymidine kinase